MHETIYSENITVYSNKGASTMRVDIIKHETYIEIRLIEINNIFTLFICTISQSDFYLYKKEQELLVDYDRFIPILVNLFYRVSQNDGMLTATMVSTKETQFTLQFIEQTEFRNLIKLSLVFNKPEEYQYRKYLGDLLTRMENDNIKLIKENKILREKAIRGDKTLQDRVKYLDETNSEMKKRIELINDELTTLEVKYNQERTDFCQKYQRFEELEKENAQLNFELESFKKMDYKTKYEEIVTSLQQKEKELMSSKELTNKLINENKDLKKHIESVEEKIKADFGEGTSFKDVKEKIDHLETKIKNYKNEIKEKKIKIENLVLETKSLKKKLENAQNVYSHFYNQNLEHEKPDHHFINDLSFEPEQPPNLKK